MGTSVTTPQGSAQEQKSRRLLAMIQERYPSYHPLMAIAEIAHTEGVDEKVKLDCHKTIAKYVEPELKSVDVSGDITETRRVIVSLFEDGEGVEQRPTPQKSISRSREVNVIEGAAMSLLDRPTVTVEMDYLWEGLISLPEELAA